MAKKVRKDGERKEEKKVVFEAPVFDEREYLEEQVHNIRLTIIFVLLGIPTGFIWAMIAANFGSTAMGLALAIVVYVACLTILKGLFSIDILGGPKKTLASTLLMFIFTALAFSVLFSNPPAMDHTPPSITDVMVDYDVNITADEDWDILMRHRSNLPINESNQERKDENPDQTMFLYKAGVTASVGDRIAILVRAADASGLRGVWVEYGYDNIDSPPEAMERLTKEDWDMLGDGTDFTMVGEHYYQYQLTAARSGSLYYKITVEDMAGHTQVFEVDVEDSIYVAEAG
jgi:hypothetical protein